MRREISLIVVLLALVGCGEEKKLPDKVNLTPEQPPEIIIPKQSEPDAVAIVNRVLAKATDGHPERISKAKAIRLSLAGVIYLNSVGTAATRKAEAVWPDRLVQTVRFTTQGTTTELMIGLRDPVYWLRKRVNGQLQPDQDRPDQKKYAVAETRDAIGRFWLPILVPLTDPDAIVFGAKTEMVDGQSLDVIKMAISGSPVYTLWFEQQSGYLGRIDFTHIEPTGASVEKRFLLTQHKSVNGIIVPMEIGYRHNILLAETWSVESWEFVDSIPEEAFMPPK